MLGFSTQEEFEAWLEEHQGDAEGLWLRIPRKGSGLKGVDYATALESALCFGWIDGQKRSLGARRTGSSGSLRGGPGVGGPR
ncbi:hypothetical protein SUDANB21_05290 [Streptomyces sp. enrichment culture]